jgi:hypothetical protein
MVKRKLALVLVLAFLCALPVGVMAQMATGPGVAFDIYRASRFETALILDVRPLEAQILLDGRPIGTARELVAQALPINLGWHTLEIGAAGFYPHFVRFEAYDAHSSASQFTVTLVPVR